VSSRPTARDRYHNDPDFHRLVDHMVSAIYSCQYTPSEMREAALLASIIYESQNIREHLYMVTPELEQALATIRRYDCNEPCRWEYAGSCTHKTSCGQEYVDEVGIRPGHCPFCHREVAS
jgi:phenylpropionate dioxygenase-like ring-hydroxylating dioxygenase large terminal subunit